MAAQYRTTRIVKMEVGQFSEISETRREVRVRGYSFIHSFFISGTWPIEGRTDRYIQKIDYTHTHIKTKT